jgi:plasmid stabilization system protein ParE
LIGDDRIEIGRILHDAMELERNLPEGYGRPE